jgi:hypothetical protein
MTAVDVAPDVRKRSADRAPGDLLLHPVAVGAMAVVIANDRLLKPHWHNDLTGKLSDVAGLIFFPLLLVALAEGVRRLAGVTSWPLTPRAVLVAVITVGTAFVLIKTWHPAGEVYRTVMGVVVWPFDAIAAAVQRAELPPVGRVALVEDRTDLLAVVALVVPGWVARRVMRTATPTPTPTGSPQRDDG